jgi:acetyl-CoA C-acetyltransferase
MGSIKDKVAIVGVGCTRFGERHDKGADGLLVEAVDEALADAGVDRDAIEAAWIGTYFPSTGTAGVALSDPLRLYGKPITRVENYCVTGMDAFRNACFGVASGMYDVALVAGVEKLKDSGDRGIPDQGDHPILGRGRSAPGGFSLTATRYLHDYGVGREVLADVAVKNHRNGARHAKAHLRVEITREQALAAPMIASPLGLYDCAPTSDGAAAIVIARPEIARDLRDDPVYVKGIALDVWTGRPYYWRDFDYTHWPTTRRAAADAYAQADITAADVDFAETHDCFTITELLNIEDLGFAEPGTAWKMVSSGECDVDGRLPINASGGLKAFGHPIGATGARMVYEVTRQLQNRSEGAQVPGSPEIGVCQNIGGAGGNLTAVAVLGR